MTAKAVIPMLVAMMLATGVCNTLLTKYQDMQCVANCDSPDPSRRKTFEQPVIQTLQMFIGESGCWLVVFGSYLYARITRASSITPAQDVLYEPVSTEEQEDDDQTGGHHQYEDAEQTVDTTNIVAKALVSPDLSGNKDTERLPLDGWKILLLAIPACCDIAGTTLMNVGLLFVAASIYQMTRGALVLFVGLFSVLFLKRHLGGWKWASLFIVVLGVAVVGLAGALERQHAQVPGDHRDDLKSRASDALALVRRLAEEVRVTAEEHTAAETVIGILLIAGAQIFSASQFVVEESIMEKYALDPLKVVGWEGIFGFTVTLILMGVLNATVGITDAGRGGYFDAREGFHEVFHNRAIAVTSAMIMVSIGGFNFFGLSVTRSISATSRSTIDTCRTLFIWIVSLGLGWESFKWLQVLGFALLVYGTGLFNNIVRPPALRFLRRRVALDDGPERDA